MLNVVPLPHNDSQRLILADVKKYGWHVVHVAGGESKLAWSFSIGLFQTLGHPEFFIVGLASSTRQTLINDLGARIKAGARFTHGTRAAGVVLNYDVALVEVPELAYADHFGYALWFYHGQEFPVLQVVWPDSTGLFPWASGFDPSLKAIQPVFGSVV